MEELVQQLRAAGFSDAEIQGYIETMEGGLREQVDAAGASVAQGLTLGLAGKLNPKVKGQAEAFRGQHRVLGGLSDIAGSVIGGLALPGSLGARLATRAATGAGASAIQSATGGSDAAEVARDAAIGGVAGVALPGAVGMASRAAKRAIPSLKSAGRQVAEGAGPLLPKNAAARMAAQEALAPGTATPVSVSPGMARSTRIIGANAPMAREAAEAAEGRMVKLQSALDDVSASYNNVLQGKTAPLDLGKGQPNIHPLAMKYGLWPGSGDVELLAVQRLRSQLRQKAASAKGMLKGELKQDIKKLSRWLESNEPAIRPLDKNWETLSSARRAEEKTVKHLAGAREFYGASRVAGMEPGSPASFPAFTKVGILNRILSRDPAHNAEAANRLLLQPGSIPEELLKARARVAQPYQPSLWAPFAVGGQTPDVMGLFE